MPHDEYVIRSFSPAHDIPRVLFLYRAVEASDRNGMDTSEQAIRANLEIPGHDPGKDRWVVEVPEDAEPLIASALIQISPQIKVADANIIVHPDWRRRGIGSDLLTKVQHRAAELNVGAIQIFANTHHPAAAGFLQKRGFIAQGAYTELRLAQGIKLPPVLWPYGYIMRPYSAVQDISILTEAMNLFYIPLWGHHAVTEQQMSSWLPEFNQQGIFLVFSEKGRVVGISRTGPSPERTTKNGVPTGYIDAPGVVPQHRRLDLYRALLLTGILWLHDQGQTIIELESWGDKLEVLKMYRELGFEDIRQLICYQLNLSGGIDPLSTVSL
jgi:mycothiol synthase